MDAAAYTRYGKIIFAIAMIAIGAVHLVTQNFPEGLEPVPFDIPARQILVNVVGVLLIAAGVMLFFARLAKHASALAGAIWLLLLGYLHIPMMVANVHASGPWTAAAETLGILSAVLIIADKYAAAPGVFKLIARFFLVVAFGILAAQHFLYFAFIETLVPAWLPLHYLWAWLVLIAFVLAAVSILVGLKVRLTGLLLATMFLLWVLILHLPRAIGSNGIEAEWTSTFVALAWCGVSLLMAGDAAD